VPWSAPAAPRASTAARRFRHWPSRRSASRRRARNSSARAASASRSRSSAARSSTTAASAASLSGGLPGGRSRPSGEHLFESMAATYQAHSRRQAPSRECGQGLWPGYRGSIRDRQCGQLVLAARLWQNPAGALDGLARARSHGESAHRDRGRLPRPCRPGGVLGRCPRLPRGAQRGEAGRDRALAAGAARSGRAGAAGAGGPDAGVRACSGSQDGEEPPAPGPAAGWPPPCGGGGAVDRPGARRADIGQGEVPWAVLADPEGNEFCVLGPLDVQP
jgi:hypothetical protein